jgi:hypothetical protein
MVTAIAWASAQDEQRDEAIPIGQRALIPEFGFKPIVLLTVKLSRIDVILMVLTSLHVQLDASEPTNSRT